MYMCVPASLYPSHVPRETEVGVGNSEAGAIGGFESRYGCLNLCPL